MNQYNREIVYTAYLATLKAAKALKEIDHNIAFVDEVWLENSNLGHIEQMLYDIGNSLYFKSQQGEEDNES